MDRIVSALGDSARWRIVELLAEQPRSVGELAELTGLRQPQTTKHLQTLARAEVVSVFPLGQRRVYALDPQPLRELGGRLRELAETAESHAGERDVIARYRAAIDAESLAAEHDRWAEGRRFVFDRTLAAAPEVVWRHWVDPDLLAAWWVPAPLRITECVLEPRPGGRAVLEYHDAEGHRYRSEGLVRAVSRHDRLVFELSVLDPTGAVMFTGHYTLTLAAAADGTDLRLELTIAETTVAAVSAIAGIETGWSRVLDNLADAVGVTH
ncbi:metalloregulator ArsR/SmtB family transcription factor [Nocardia spumae]|uniref:metalloregulator ArsR/SmtB family transcription factor n=1 Tax=Nocardia spumae TaxID=2887190 RepID=UPI001D13D90D|nr:metalloregulator ArsR/SmtB family transcription factor [Nocardia spumae]